jgi:serine/threonine protein phosphatase PrpC
VTQLPTEPPAQTQTTAKCPHCGALLDPGDRFCEACGKAVTDGATATPAPATGEANPLDDLSPISAVTVKPATADAGPEEGVRPPCLECGGAVDGDGYCTQCGTKAPKPRDHFEEQPAPWVAGVCDRGVRHHRNEDAMAMAVDGDRAVLVVCDGVSNTVDSDVASLAAARAVLDVLRAPLPKGLGVPESAAAAVAKVFADAAAAGNREVLATCPDDVPNPPSCTLVAAVLEDGVVHYCGVGDSRVYLLPDAGHGRILTIDDSMAQVMIAGGTPRADAEASKQAHSITKWLGKDSPDITPRVGSARVTGPGWLLACSDGLWNYASEPAAVLEQIRAAGSDDPLVIARHLVDFSNAAGGQDNIAAVLARVGEPPLVEEAAGATSSPTGGADVGKNAVPNGGETDG